LRIYHQIGLNLMSILLSATLIDGAIVPANDGGFLLSSPTC
jgi:hypothetical protein